MDMPGFGGSPPLPPGTEASPAELARAVAAFVREEVGPDPIEVGGHSLGGWTALELAKLGVARRVTAVAPAGFWRGWEGDYARTLLKLTAWSARSQGAVLEAGFRRPRARVALAAGQFGFPERVTADALRRMFATLRDATGFDEALAAATQRRFEGGESIDVPVTVLWGTRDGLLLPRQAKRVRQELPEAELIMVPHAGHFAHWDDPDATMRALLRQDEPGRDPLPLAPPNVPR
ncbi:MAG: hypothetical protein QOD53_1707 [Thermoleophilaceae bacterium]|nr:hypothetical protein [Thermoleophilaceae bacterium]